MRKIFYTPPEPWQEPIFEDKKEKMGRSYSTFFYMPSEYENLKLSIGGNFIDGTGGAW